MPIPGLAIALGSSFLGYHAHAGFLNGLSAAGIVPERISGASAGAIAGSMFAAGLRGDALEKAALDPALRWSFLDGKMIFRVPLLNSGLLSGTRAVRHLRRLLGDIDLSSLTHPAMEIAVTDAIDHRPEILRRGPLAELIVASCAVPGLITIQRVGDRRFLDGGIACEMPFEHWLDDDRVHTIVLHRIVRDDRPSGGGSPLFHAIGSVHRTVSGELHRHRVALARAAGKRLIEIDTITPAPALFSSKNSRACYDAGHTAAGRVSDAIGIQGVPPGNPSPPP